jgi:hypothetical protein
MSMLRKQNVIRFLLTEALFVVAAITAPAAATAIPDCPVGTINDFPPGGPEGCFPSGPSGSPEAELAYLHLLEERGINPGNPDGAAADARMICNSINAGNDFSTVQLNAMRWTNLPYRTAATVVVEAIIFFCPDTNDVIFERFQDAENGQ